MQNEQIIGYLIQAITLIVILCGVYYKMDARQTATDKQIDHIETDKKNFREQLDKRLDKQETINLMYVEAINKFNLSILELSLAIKHLNEKIK